MAEQVPVARVAPIGFRRPKSLDEYVFPVDLADTGGTGVDLNRNTFHVDFLKSKFRDMARPNQFRISIFPPEVLRLDWDNDLMVLAKSAAFPSIEISDYEYSRAGKVLHIPTNKVNYGDMNITFYNDIDFSIRTMLQQWQRYALLNWNENVGSVPSMALQGLVTIFQFDASHRCTYAVQCDNAWPKMIGDISLSHDDTDTAETFNVQFVYTEQEIIKNYNIERTV